MTWDEDQLAFCAAKTSTHFNLTLAEQPCAAASCAGRRHRHVLRNFLLSSWFKQFWFNLSTASERSTASGRNRRQTAKEMRYQQPCFSTGSCAWVTSTPGRPPIWPPARTWLMRCQTIPARRG
jgi:hypothetical protein